MVRKLILLSALISFLAIPFLSAPVCRADVPKFDLDTEQVIRENLTKLSDKTVTLRLTSGEEVSGKVSEVGKTAVRLSALTGKEFYDAVIPLTQVVALIVRTK